VTPASPAADAGLEVGDVIVSIAGRRIEAGDEVLSEIGTKRPGSALSLEVVRPTEAAGAGGRRNVTATLGTLDPSVNARPFVAAFERAGLAGLADGERGGRRGVTVASSRGPVAGEVPAGSLIVALDGLRVASLDDLWVRLTRSAVGRVRIAFPPSARITVLRPDGAERDVDVPLVPR
jgi:serine protease Do